MSQTVIIDYGMGNVGSITNLLDRLGTPFRCSSEPAEILSADRLILPGVGHFGEGMLNLGRRGLIAALNEAVMEKRIPILGICLGMQLMTRHSEEGDADGLGWFDAVTRRFSFTEGSRIRVPHVGFNSVEVKKASLFKHCPPDPHFYFTHSYFVQARNPEQVAGRTELGGLFDSAIETGNIFGVQFHPEKSHKSGLALMKAFCEMQAC